MAAATSAAGQRLVFGALLALHVAPIWTVRYPPSCDGPAHLETAYDLLHRGSPEHRLYAKHFALRRDPTVAWFPALALAAMMKTRLVEPVAALKLLVTGYVVLFPLALRYALVGFSRRSAWLACAGFPLVYSRPLLYGFYGFLYGLTVFLFTLGWWWRRQPGAPYAWPLTGLTLALQLTHASSLVAALLTFGALGLAALWRERRWSPEHHAVTRGLREHLLAPLHAFLPALILLCAFLLPRVEARPAEADGPSERPTADPLRTLPVVIEGDRPIAAAFAAAFLACLAAIAVRVALGAWRARRWICADGLLAAAAVWLGLWLFGPATMAHASFLRERCALYFLVTVVLWCGARGFPGEDRLGAVVALLAAGWVGVQAARFRQVSRDVEEYASLAPHIASGSTLLPVGTPAAGFGGIPFLEHAASYVAVARGGINLGNYQPGTDHFPLVWRERWLAREEAPDYLLISAPGGGAVLQAPTTVRGEYAVVGVSRPRAQVTLLRRRGPVESHDRASETN